MSPFFSGPFRFVRRAWDSSAVRYLVVGGVAFLIDIGLLALLRNVFGVALVVATPTAFLLSFGLTYIMQRHLTFDSKGAWGASALKYTALVIFNTFATTAIVTGTAALGWPWEIGKIVAVGATTVWNYFGYRYWIFRRTRDI